MDSEIHEEQEAESSSPSPPLSEVPLTYESYELEGTKARILVDPLHLEKPGLRYPPQIAYYQERLAQILKGWKKKVYDDERLEKFMLTGFRRSCGKKQLTAAVVCLVLVILVIAIPIAIMNTKKVKEVPAEDRYAVALKKALLFFDAQISGPIRNNSRVPWRGDSCLHEPNNLVGGFYDGGDAIKYTFPTAFSISILSWSVTEFRHKYEAIGEYEHVRDIIKWGTDYLLRTFDSSSNFTVTMIYTQVGNAGVGGPEMPNEGFCWQKPEDIRYNRTVGSTKIGADVAGEVIAALASASLVFKDDAEYASQLKKGAEKLIDFCNLPGSKFTYTSLQKNVTYQSSDYHDEEIWWATWMFFATGNYTYLSRANGEELAREAQVFNETLDLPVFNFNNKLPGALLLLTRARIIFGFPYPYEEMLRKYHEVTEDIMCSYLHKYNIFNFTEGGLILLRNGETKPLQYAANAAYISALFAGYLESQGIPAWTCGSDNILIETLRAFSASQVDYILGANPKSLSYLVGYGSRFPTHVHHRGASIPNDGTSYGCTEGFKWRDTPRPNPNNITGAMVDGPDKFDRFRDVRAKRYNAEPTLTGNAALVAALAALTVNGGRGVDVDAIFSELKPLTPSPPPPPSPWNPFHG